MALNFISPCQFERILSLLIIVSVKHINKQALYSGVQGLFIQFNYIILLTYEEELSVSDSVKLEPAGLELADLGWASDLG